MEPAHLTRPEVKALLALAQRHGGKGQTELLLEGPKIISEALQSGWKPLILVFGPDGSYDLDGTLAHLSGDVLVRKASSTEMERISRLKSAPSIIACFEIPKDLNATRSSGLATKQPFKLIAPWWLVADRIQDPGNLGTMIRIADWFGFEGLICSLDTVDCYNSKVIQASMGSLFRVPIHYVDLNPVELTRLTGMIVSDTLFSEGDRSVLTCHHEKPWLIAAMPGGMDLNQIQFPRQGGMLLVGNESQGLSQNLLQYATHRAGIPLFGSAESLNAAVATGIFANAIRRAESEVSKTP